MKPINGNTEVTLGEYCRLLRKREKMSISALATKCGLHRNTISLIERDCENVTIETLRKIFNVFGLEINVTFLDRTIQKVVK